MPLARDAAQLTYSFSDFTLSGALDRVCARRAMIIEILLIQILGVCHGKGRFGDCCGRISNIRRDREFSERCSGGTIMRWFCWLGMR